MNRPHSISHQSFFTLALAVTMLACSRSRPTDADADARAKAAELAAQQERAIADQERVQRCCLALSELWAQRGGVFQTAGTKCTESIAPRRPSTEVFADVLAIVGADRVPAACK